MTNPYDLKVNSAAAVLRNRASEEILDLDDSIIIDTIVKKDEKFEQWDVKSLGAVPYAINSGAKMLIFRPFWSPDHKVFNAPKSPINKGFFYTFNSNIEIKLVKYTFEDNGLVEHVGGNANQLLPNQV